MTVAVAASLHDLPLSLALLLGMDDVPDAPMRHPPPPPYTPRTTTPTTTHGPQILHTLTTPTHSPRTTGDPLTQQTQAKTTFDTFIPHHQASTSFESYPAASGPAGSSSWGGMSPESAITPSLSFYGSPALSSPSPRPTPTPEGTTHSHHTERTSHRVSVTVTDLTSVTPQNIQAHSDYTGTFTESGYTAAPSPGPSYTSPAGPVRCRDRKSVV